MAEGLSSMTLLFLSCYKLGRECMPQYENICATIIDSFNARIPKVIVIQIGIALSMFFSDATTPACLKVTEAGL